MIVANFTSIHPTMGDTRTYEDFSKFIGSKPTRLGIVSRLYDDLTASYLTEGLKNIVYLDGKSTDKYRKINTMYYEWNTETNEIKRIKFAEVPTDTGANGTDITMAFTERYFEKYDIFKIEKSRQQCIVIGKPIRVADQYWTVNVRLIDNDYLSVLDVSACQVGDPCIFQSNAMPEMSEEGYSKYQSSIETHRNYITCHRCDVDWSSLYAATEDMFVSIGDSEEKKEVMYKLKKVEKDLLDNFLFVRNSGCLFNKTNVDAHGKATVYDPATGRPIYIGDGAIPQIERFASKYGFQKLTIDVFQAVLSMMSEKSKAPTGNNYLFITNEKLWQDVQKNLGDFLFKFNTNGTFMFSKVAGDYLSVGNTFNTYEFGGNKISFKVDRTYTREYGRDKGYGTCIDLTADSVSGTPAIEMFTLKNGDFITSKYLGIGGMTGLESGVVSSPVAGSKLVYMGYSSIGVYNPYRSFIIYEL
jgi:hypothetical protein